MRLRATHLVYVLLLLSSLGAAEAATQSSGRHGFDSYSVGIFLHEEAIRGYTESIMGSSAQTVAGLPLPSAALAQSRVAWTMRPPSAHSSQVVAATGSGL